MYTIDPFSLNWNWQLCEACHTCLSEYVDTTMQQIRTPPRWAAVAYGVPAYRYGGNSNLDITHYNDVIMSAIIYSTVYSRCRSKKTPKLLVTGLCDMTSEFPAQKASNAENVSIGWRLQEQIVNLDVNAFQAEYTHASSSADAIASHLVILFVVTTP